METTGSSGGLSLAYVRDDSWGARLARAAAAAAMTAALAGCGAVATRPVEPAPAVAPSAAVEQPPPEKRFPPNVLYRLLVAEFALRRGDAEQAARAYLEVAQETGDRGAAERATRIAVYARDEDGGLQASRLWVQLDPDGLEARRAEAVLLVRAGRMEEALERLRQIARRWNDEPGQGYGLVADLLNNERDKGRRVVLMEQLVADMPGDVHAQASLARVAARSGQVDKAAAIMQRAYDLDPSIDRHAVFHASMLRAQGKTEESLVVLANQVERSPANEDVRMVYARFLVDAKRYEEARAQFEHLAANDPERSDVRYALGLLLLQTNHLPEAKTQFEKLLEIGERRVQAHFYLGQIAEGQSEYPAAIQHYRAVDRGDQYLSAQMRVAAIYAQEGNLQRARQHLSAVRRESVSDEIRLYRAEAELLAQVERLTDAIRVYDIALEAHPKNTDLLYARAMVAARADQLEILERDLRDILSREPNNADALNALGYSLADRTDRHEEAYALIKRALQIKPDDHYIIDSLGWVLYRMGRLDEAVEHLQRAISIKQDAEVAAHLGEVLWVLGRKNEAQEVWDSALKLTPQDKRLIETINRFSK